MIFFDCNQSLVMYSTLLEEKVTLNYLWLCWEIRPSTSINAYPNVGQQVFRSPIQLEFVQPWKTKGWKTKGLCKKIWPPYVWPMVQVVLRYQNTLLTLDNVCLKSYSCWLGFNKISTSANEVEMGDLQYILEFFLWVVSRK